MDEPLLDISGLRTYFHTKEGIVKAIDDVNISLGKGEVLGIAGESGCGKSTLALSILRLIPKPGRIESGKILLDNKDLLKMTEDELRETRGGQIAMIFQDPNASLNPVFNVGSQVAEMIELHDKDVSAKKEVLGRSIEMMTTVRIPDARMRYNDYPHQFSGGMRQRVMIAMALSCNPKMLIADEPTTSLDVTIQAQILELMSELKRKYSSSVLLITHDMGVIAELSDRVAIMYAGKIVEYADAIEIFSNSLHPYTQSLLASIPRPDRKRERLETIPGSVPSLITPPPGCRFHPRCRYVGERCMSHDPAIEEVKPGHHVACFNYQQVKGA